jgi:hypothetical protein
MSHAFTTNDRASDFYSTLLTGNTLVTNTAVLLTRTFVVFYRSKDSLVEKTVLFRTLCTVVDGLRFCDLTI